MPNLVLEYSDPVAEQVNITAMLEDLHQTCLMSGLFEPDSIKSRSYPCHRWLIGEHEDSKDFIHIQFSLLDGRSEETRKQLAEQLLAVMRHHAPSVYSLTIDVREMEKAIFTRAIQG
uniref:5-carboxymethyl-2-hydroxymuconate Delta-isomerase n=1 Tax=Thaumasiovibrio occultus TaxID=1891184 RepID=UPI000B355E28|nr:5-carboxymethyl-2-hydroxymuconate Delta-isomerase [Thaumasiovibrio occultus]